MTTWAGRRRAQRGAEPGVTRFARGDRHKYEVDEDTGCWIWFGASRRDGTRPALRIAGRTVPAYRWFWENRPPLYCRCAGCVSDGWRTHRRAPEQCCASPHPYRRVPQRLELDHVVCDNSLCVNPAHVEPASRTRNAMRGMQAYWDRRRRRDDDEEVPF